MNNLGYSEYIRNQINNAGYNNPILTTEIAHGLEKKYALKYPNARQIVNQHLKRMSDDKTIARFARGIYYKPVMTPFGASVLNDIDVFTSVLTEDKGDIIGYEGCPSVLNTLGLSTQMSAEKFIVTNKYRKVLPKTVKIKMIKPQCTVTSENYKYLQLIDIILGIKKYPIDAVGPKKIIMDHINRSGIDVIKLLAYAKKIDPNKALGAVIDFFTEGLV